MNAFALPGPALAWLCLAAAQLLSAGRRGHRSVDGADVKMLILPSTRCGGTALKHSLSPRADYNMGKWVSAWFDARLRGSVPRGCLGLARCGDRKSHLECQFHFRFWASIRTPYHSGCLIHLHGTWPHQPQTQGLYTHHILPPCLLQTQASKADNSVATTRPVERPHWRNLKN